MGEQVIERRSAVKFYRASAAGANAGPAQQCDLSRRVACSAKFQLQECQKALQVAEALRSARHCWASQQWHTREWFDGIFFLDLPSREEKNGIWTGAEIKACCRLSALLDVPLVQAAQNVVPVAATAAESIARLRTWASGRCLSAQQSGLYQAKPTQTGAGSRRKGNRDSSMN